MDSDFGVIDFGRSVFEIAVFDPKLKTADEEKSFEETCLKTLGSNNVYGALCVQRLKTFPFLTFVIDDGAIFFVDDLRCPLPFFFFGKEGLRIIYLEMFHSKHRN